MLRSSLGRWCPCLPVVEPRPPSATRDLEFLGSMMAVLAAVDGMCHIGAAHREES